MRSSLLLAFLACGGGGISHQDQMPIRLLTTTHLPSHTFLVPSRWSCNRPPAGLPRPLVLRPAAASGREQHLLQRPPPPLLRLAPLRGRVRRQSHHAPPAPPRRAARRVRPAAKGEGGMNESAHPDPLPHVLPCEELQLPGETGRGETPRHKRLNPLRRAACGAEGPGKDRRGKGRGRGPLRHSRAARQQASRASGRAIAARNAGLCSCPRKKRHAGYIRNRAYSGRCLRERGAGCRGASRCGKRLIERTRPVGTSSRLNV